VYKADKSLLWKACCENTRVRKDWKYQRRNQKP